MAKHMPEERRMRRKKQTDEGSGVFFLLYCSAKETKQRKRQRGKQPRARGRRSERGISRKALAGNYWIAMQSPNGMRVSTVPLHSAMLQTGMEVTAKALPVCRGGGGVLPYKGLMGTCGRPGYVFRDFCLEQGIEFIIFCLNQGIDLSIFVLNWVKCLNQGIKNRNSVLKWVAKSAICLKQGQGMRGRAAPPQPGIHRVPPPPPPRGL